MKVWTLAATLLVAVSAATAVFAAKALTPKAQLEKAATHIVVGKVRSITPTTNQAAQYATTAYAAVIAISDVEIARVAGQRLATAFRLRPFATAQGERHRSRVPGEPGLQRCGIYDRRPLRRVLQERL